MEKLRKQIKESFFNPVLHFLPLLVFIVVDEFLGMNVAWKISFPVAMALLVYIYFTYNRIFAWNLIFAFLFVAVGFVSSILVLLPISSFFLRVGSELVLLFFVSGYMLFRKRIQHKLLKVVSRLIPMTNNFLELNRFVWMLFSLILFYILGNAVLYFEGLQGTSYGYFLREVYVGGLIFFSVYEIIRVQIIRSKLLREEWWPIVTETGKVVGSVQHLSSLNDEKKYMHPVVRVLIVDNGKILLQKRPTDSFLYPGIWDAAVSDHVKMGETIEQCIERTALDRYGLSNFRYMHLANYTLEVEKEFHYAFLFVSCLQMEVRLDVAPESKRQLKWWTQSQIENELKTGIFSPNFVMEYDLLKRSGLLDTGRCDCVCRLKETIYSNQSKETENE